jgi:hypothetical protein
MPRILILTFSKTAQDPRVLRQIQALKDNCNLTVAGCGAYSDDKVDYIQLPSLARNFIGKILNAVAIVFGFYEFSYWSAPRVAAARKLLLDQKFDLVLANELSSLPLALELAKPQSAKVLLDAHEFYPGHMPEKIYFRLVGAKLWSYLTKKYIPLADSRMTVSQGIADEYKKYCGADFFLFQNSPYFENQTPSKIDSERIRLVHSGGFSPGRQPEVMLQLMNLLDARFTLDLMFVANAPDLLNEFKKLCSANPRIRFVDPVSVEHVARRLNEYDIGLYLLPIRSLNQRFALPNKIFEFIQARLAIAVWPSPEMGRFVESWNVGWVSADATVESMAHMLNGISIESLGRMKANTQAAAEKTCCEIAVKRLQMEIDSLLA